MRILSIPPAAIPRRYLAGLLGLALLTCTGGWTGRSSAQAQEGTSFIKLRLVEQPVFYEPGSTLGMTVEATNPTSLPIATPLARIGVCGRTLSRSALQAVYEGSPCSELGVQTVPFKGEIGAFKTRTLTIDIPVDSFPHLAAASEGGVYPANVSLLDPTSLSTLASLGTPFLYYPEAPRTRLKIAVLLPFNQLPEQVASGGFTTPSGEEPGLEESLAEGGWLEGYLDAIEEATRPIERPAPPPRRRQGRSRARVRERPPPPRPLRLSIAPTARLIDELAKMSDGFQRVNGVEVAADSGPSEVATETLARFGELGGREEIQPILGPYAFADLPTVVRELPIEQMLQQFDAANNVLSQQLGIEPGDDWLFPPAGRLDQQGLEQLQLVGLATRSFFSEDSLVPFDDPVTEACPEQSPSFTCAIVVETALGTTRGYVADQGLSNRLLPLQNEDDERLLLQRFFAETAQIHQELPGVPDRVIQVTIPSLWHPRPAMSRLLLNGLRRAPWLRSVTAAEGLENATHAARQITPLSEPISNAPDPEYFDAIEHPHHLVSSYKTMITPGNERLERLRRNLLVAQSRSLWRNLDLGEDYIAETQAEVEGEMGKVAVLVDDDITLTSDEAPVQLLILNNATYPVTVDLELISSDLDFADTTITDTYEPGNHPLTVQARVKSSGAFPLVVSLGTTDGYEIETQEILVRSTSFNRVALGITVGALAFLIIFYLFRAVRQRRVTRAETQA
jgi:hypothetical protein